jgi:hypothetical protein
VASASRTTLRFLVSLFLRSPLSASSTPVLAGCSGVRLAPHPVADGPRRPSPPLSSAPATLHSPDLLQLDRGRLSRAAPPRTLAGWSEKRLASRASEQRVAIFASREGSGGRGLDARKRSVIELRATVSWRARSPSVRETVASPQSTRHDAIAVGSRRRCAPVGLQLLPLADQRAKRAAENAPASHASSSIAGPPTAHAPSAPVSRGLPAEERRRSGREV